MENRKDVTHVYLSVSRVGQLKLTVRLRDCACGKLCNLLFHKI